MKRNVIITVILGLTTAGCIGPLAMKPYKPVTVKKVVRIAVKPDVNGITSLTPAPVEVAKSDAPVEIAKVENAEEAKMAPESSKSVLEAFENHDSAESTLKDLAGSWKRDDGVLFKVTDQGNGVFLGEVDFTEDITCTVKLTQDGEVINGSATWFHKPSGKTAQTAWNLNSDTDGILNGKTEWIDWDVFGDTPSYKISDRGWDPHQFFRVEGSDGAAPVKDTTPFVTEPETSDDLFSNMKKDAEPVDDTPVGNPMGSYAYGTPEGDEELGGLPGETYTPETPIEPKDTEEAEEAFEEEAEEDLDADDPIEEAVEEAEEVEEVVDTTPVPVEFEEEAWVRSGEGVSIPHPKGWVERSANGMTMLTGDSSNGFADVITTIAQPNMMNMGLDSILEQNKMAMAMIPGIENVQMGKTTIGDTEVVKVEFEAKEFPQVPVPVHIISIMKATPEKITVVQIMIDQSRWASQADLISATIDGLSFIAPEPALNDDGEEAEEEDEDMDAEEEDEMEAEEAEEAPQVDMEAEEAEAEETESEEMEAEETESEEAHDEGDDNLEDEDLPDVEDIDDEDLPDVDLPDDEFEG